MEVGDRVVVDGLLTGIVMYMGRVDGASEEHVGVELDVSIGDTDGTLNGKRYFKCGAGKGVFRRRSEVKRYMESEYNRTCMENTSAEKYITCRSIEESELGHICESEANLITSRSTQAEVAMMLDESVSIQRKAEEFRKELEEKKKELERERRRRVECERTIREYEREIERTRSEWRIEKDERKRIESHYTRKMEIERRRVWETEQETAGARGVGRERGAARETGGSAEEILERIRRDIDKKEEIERIFFSTLPRQLL
jgi:CAP-Gly domain